MPFDFSPIFGLLHDMFGATVTVYPHKGYEGETSDDFWQEDQGWEDQGSRHDVLVDEEMSNEELRESGFAEEADFAIWSEDAIAEEGDKIEYLGNSFVVISTDSFHSGTVHARQIIGVKEITE